MSTSGKASMDVHKAFTNNSLSGCADEVTLLNSTRVASTISSVLQTRGISHAIIGGIACVLLGGKRSTEDVDIVVDLPGPKVAQLIAELADEYRRFMKGNGRLCLYDGTTPLEFLSVDHFAWPSPLRDHVLSVAFENTSVSVLRPTAILVNKVIRVGGFLSLGPLASRPPKSQLKTQTDLYDIAFLLNLDTLDDMITCAAAYKPETRTRLRAWITLLLARKDEWLPLLPGDSFDLDKLSDLHLSLPPAPHERSADLEEE